MAGGAKNDIVLPVSEALEANGYINTAPENKKPPAIHRRRFFIKRIRIISSAFCLSVPGTQPTCRNNSMDFAGNYERSIAQGCNSRRRK